MEKLKTPATILTSAAISLGVVVAYHHGYLNWIPGLEAPKKAGPIGK